MPIAHLFLALLVAVIWGVNFLFVKLALEEVTPLLLCFIRFLLASIPVIFFIKPPNVPFRIIALYGLVMFALQFALLFIGMHLGITPSMASLVIQMQVFFSMFFAALFIGERPSIWQIVGALVSSLGIGLVINYCGKQGTLLGFIFILAAAMTWGLGNLITKKTPKVNIIGLIGWGSFVACWPMLLLSLLFEGVNSIVYSYHHINWQGAMAIAYIVYVSTWIGYGVWNWLLNRYPLSSIAPFTLLVPLIGMLSSILILGEPFQLWKLFSALLVIGGLCLNVFGSRYLTPKLSISLLNAPKQVVLKDQ